LSTTPRRRAHDLSMYPIIRGSCRDGGASSQNKRLRHEFGMSSFGQDYQL